MFFDNDVERIAGWNDGQKITIPSSSLASPVVQAHEALHGRIFNETADGQLHRLCCKASGTDLDKRFGGIYTNLSKMMFLDGKQAHEAAATYLTIQSLPTRNLRKSEYRDLTKEYRGYYDALAGLIDPISKTTWLRYAFGWSLIHWCFYSLRSTKFFSLSEPSFEPFLDPSPSRRLEEVSKFLRNGKRLKNWVTDSVNEASSKYSATGRLIWDLEDENEWNKRAKSRDLQFLESLLTSASGSWLLDKSNIETIDFRDGKGLSGPGFDLLVSELRIIPKQIFTGELSVLDSQWRADNDEMLALAHGRDTVIHTPSCPILDMSAADQSEAENQILAALRKSTRCTILSRQNSTEKFLILCRASSDADENKVGAFKNLGTFSVGAGLASTSFHAAVDAGLPTYVVMTTDEDRLLETATLAIGLFTGKANDEKILMRAPIIFYQEGDWADLYTTQGTEFTSYNVALKDTNDGKPKPISIRIAKPPIELPTYFIALKPHVSGFRLDKYEEASFQKGNLKRAGLEKSELDKIVIPIADAWHVWSEF